MRAVTNQSLHCSLTQRRHVEECHVRYMYKASSSIEKLTMHVLHILISQLCEQCQNVMNMDFCSLEINRMENAGFPADIMAT